MLSDRNCSYPPKRKNAFTAGELLKGGESFNYYAANKQLEAEMSIPVGSVIGGMIMDEFDKRVIEAFRQGSPQGSYRTYEKGCKCAYICT